MGCDYIKELRRGGNASYRSEQVMSVFLCALSDTIKGDIVTEMRNSPSKGVATCLKHLNNNIILIHHVAYYLALAAGPASQRISDL